MASSGFQTLTGKGRIALAAVTTIKEVTGRLSVPGRAQLIGANSQARNARGMDGPWLPRSGAGWGDRRDCDVVEVL